MADTSHDPVDHARTARPYVGESLKDPAKMPGLILLGISVLAVMLCLAGFATEEPGGGVAAAAVAVLSAGAGLAWLGVERRRIRAAERQWRDRHRDLER